MNPFVTLNNDIRRMEKRAFGKDLTNLNFEKNEKMHSKIP